MRVIHVVGDSQWGGGGGIIMALASMARQDGATVDFLATDPICQDVARQNGLHVVDLDVIWRDIRPLRDIRGLMRLYKFFRSNSYDLVHTHTSKAGFVGRIAARMAGVPVVLHTAHAFSFHEESGFVERSAFVQLEKLAARFCDCIVTVSNYHRLWALRLGLTRPAKLVAIPNGLPQERIAQNESIATVRNRWQVADSDAAIVVAGRLAAGKGLEYLIGAVAAIRNISPRPFRVILAGDGPIRKDLETLVAQKGLCDLITFTGFCKNVGSLLAASDMIVMPSLHEGLSMSLLEAMAAGKPIVATSIGSNSEATQQGVGALLVPPKDSEALAEAMLHYLSNPALASEKAAAARAIYLANYTQERMTEGYRNIYRQLIDQAPRSRSAFAGQRPQENAS